MATALSLSPAEVDGVLAVLGEAAAGDCSQPFTVGVVERLSQIIRADWQCYFEYTDGDDNSGSHSAREPAFFVPIVACSFDWDEPEVRAALRSWTLHDGIHRRSTVAVRLSDTLTTRQKQRNVWYATMMRLCGQEHQIKVWLPMPAGRIGGFSFIRETGRRDFDERERAILTVLRPHLGTIRARWERHYRLRAGLTAREFEVMTLLRDGLTNKEIANRLVMSPSTVRTHLEHVFDKLAVHTRTAALARVFDRTS